MQALDEQPAAVVFAGSGTAQLVVHKPHAAVVLVRLTSQPLGSIASQFAKPALQLMIAQLPVEQVADAFAREHATPQPPQFVVVVIEVSQPAAAVQSA